MRRDIRDPRAARFIARALAATPPPQSWWTRTDLTWEQFTALAQERAAITGAVSTNYAQPVKMGDE